MTCASNKMRVVTKMTMQNSCRIITANAFRSAACGRSQWSKVYIVVFQVPCNQLTKRHSL